MAKRSQSEASIAVVKLMFCQLDELIRTRREANEIAAKASLEKMHADTELNKANLAVERQIKAIRDYVKGA